MKLGVITLQNAAWPELVERWRTLEDCADRRRGTGGRLEVGVGSGAAAHDHELAQVPNWEPKQRAALFVDWLERLVTLLADERLQPKAPVPLTIAGRGSTILGLAARYAGRWNTFGGFGIDAKEGVRRGREDNARLDELCAETGRTVLRSALIGYPFVAETPWCSDDAAGPRRPAARAASAGVARRRWQLTEG